MNWEFTLPLRTDEAADIRGIMQVPGLYAESLLNARMLPIPAG